MSDTMVARNMTLQDVATYSGYLQQVPAEEERNFLSLEGLKPVMVQQGGIQPHIQPYQPTYYELTNLVQNAPCSSTAVSYPPSVASSSCASTMMDVQVAEPPPPSTIRKKRKASSHDVSEMDEEMAEDAKSTKTDENKKQNHSEIEKRRRDKMNTYITELSSLIPMCNAMSRKLDKLTVLRMAVQHVKTIKESLNSQTEGKYKPSFMSDEELKKLLLQIADGFLFVVGCDRGRFLFLSESVSKVLNYTQADLLGQSIFDIIHPKDVAKVKEQLTSSDMSPRERLIDAKTMLPVKTDEPEKSSKFCTGARRSFFCRMRSRTEPQKKDEAETSTTAGNRRKNKQLAAERKYSVIHCTGYLKSWPPAQIGLEKHDDPDMDTGCNLCCLVAIGRILPHISTVAANHHPNAAPIQFVSRHALDGKFTFVDQNATLILGFVPQELLGTSMYEYYHQDDISAVAERHKMALKTTEFVHTGIYRFRTKEGNYIRLETDWRQFMNPWTKEIEYMMAKNTLVVDFRNKESTASGTQVSQDMYDFFTNPTEQNIQRLINTQVEASKIGREIVDQVTDLQRSESPQQQTSMSNVSNIGETRNLTNIETHIPSTSNIQPCDLYTTPPPPVLPDFTSTLQDQYSIPVARDDTMADFADINVAPLQLPLPQQQQPQTSMMPDPGKHTRTLNPTAFVVDYPYVAKYPLPHTLYPVSPQLKKLKVDVSYSIPPDTHRKYSPLVLGAGPSPAEGSSSGFVADMLNPVPGCASGPVQQHHTSQEGNDEAAMAVIMSLLEADAGLGGPVDFSGLPWPLP
ncbi:aryl hydrocarbon receptor nuclear translocator-like protein 1 isoform X2 [Sitophilus oryzae]|uniref:Aryl hydrocarbon receptor nuclear translocator-like protein 1 isoform X2 n=1 Tax=Sitophilus oryzae TaxID=7048 RepID=A0A6J2YTF7_SITOR|nr:aryl hydrocarbon receptor nuclear translocator-like protein 1 isoform X2 [Sitophilus oryzae]